MSLKQNIALKRKERQTSRELNIIKMQNEIKLEQFKQRVMDVRPVNYGYSNGAASHSKNSFKGWTAESGSPQQDIDMNLHTLRQRSRDVYMNAPIATSAIKANRTNCVGEGLVLSPKVNYTALGFSRDEAKQLEKDIKQEWNLWARSKYCDVKGIDTFSELQQVAFLSWLINGECFAAIDYEKPKAFMPYQLRIKLIEADKVSSPGEYGEFIDLYKKNTENGNRIINGVEINEKGTVQAYWISNSYQYEPVNKEWIRVEAVGSKTGNPNILHVFEAERCEQYRGVPFLTPVIESIKQLSRYQEAEIMAAVINGLFTVFVTTEDGSENIDFAGLEDEDETDEDEKNYNLGNGLINYLAPGEKIEIADSKRPNNNFDPFVKSFCKYIGAALEIPVEVLLLEFTASYSASRGALLQAGKAFRMKRRWFATDFCQPVYEIWLSEAVAKDRVHAPGFFDDPLIKAAYCNAEWNGPALGQLDPVKEAQGATLRIQAGLSTRERECIEVNGSDFEENWSQLVIETEKMEEIGGKNDEQN